MQKLQDWLQTRFYSVLMLLLVGGFLTLLAELVITDHLDGIQLVGVVASIAGTVLTLAALFVSSGARKVVAVLLLLLSVSGVMGAYQHYENRSGGEEAMRPASLARVYQPAGFQLQEDEGEEAGGASAPPPLAPLSLAGLMLDGRSGDFGRAGEARIPELKDVRACTS